jgi:hypothetical protein
MATALATASRHHASPRAPQQLTVRMPTPKKAKKVHHRKAGKLASNIQNLGAFALAGYLLGMLDKSGTSFPTVPMLGRAGTLAVGLHFLGKGNKMMQEASLAAAAIAGYEMGGTGKISGGPVPQISGVASQV